jgi:hypothetical protein
MNENLIREAIKSYKSQGFRVIAEWNAGNDQCICGTKIGDKTQSDYQGIDIAELLNELVIQALELPSTGECYHIGSGIIDINEEDKVFIRCTAEFEYSDYSVDFFYEEIKSDGDNSGRLKDIKAIQNIEDPFELKKILHRANVNFSGKINKEKETETTVIIDVVQGDEITLSEEQKSFYKPIITEILLKGLEEFKKLETPLKKAENHYYFASIELEGQLHSDSTLHYKLSPSSEYFENFRDEVVILVE